MSLIQDFTHISVIASKENMITMLNAAIRRLTCNPIISPSDSLEVIHRKLREPDGRYYISIGIPDLLSDEALRDPELIAEKRQYEELAAKREAFFSGNLEISDEEAFEQGLFEDVSDERAIEVVRVDVSGSSYVLHLSLYECEGCAWYQDWAGWDDIARVYDCTVVVDALTYRNGAFSRFCGATVYRPGEAARIEPDLKLSEFCSDFDKLVSLNPTRAYRDLQITCMESMLLQLQNELTECRLKQEVERLPYNGGTLVVPEGITDLSSRTFPDRTLLRRLVVPASVEYIDLHGCTNLESVEVAPDNPRFSSAGSCLLDKEGRTILDCSKLQEEPDRNDDLPF